MPDSLLDPAEVSFFARIQNLVGFKDIEVPVKIRNICGVDAAYSKDTCFAGAVVLAEGQLKETSAYIGKFTFPYLRGLFFLHEGPFVVAAVEKLRSKPDLVCFDAHGLAHPNFRGLASTCGAVLRTPSIGIAKKLLVGDVVSYKRDLDKVRFAGSDVGFVISRRKKTYWSPGYSVSLHHLEEIIEDLSDVCLESLERAHRLSREALKSA